MSRTGPLQWMVIGAGPAAAKTCLTIGLSWLLSARGIHVAPFKPIAVMQAGALLPDVGREHPAPGVIHQLGAIGLAPDRATNPVVVWQTSDRQGDLVVMGEPAGAVELLNRDAIRFDRLSSRQRALIADAVPAAYDTLRLRYEAIVIEGAGSPIEASDADDWANQRVMHFSGAPALLVGRLSSGGAAAALIGTLVCLGPELRGQVVGLVLSDVDDEDAAQHAIALLQRHAGTRLLGTIPRLLHGVDSANPADYPIAYRAWADAVSTRLDLNALGPPFTVAT